MGVVSDIEDSGLIHRRRVGRTDDDLGDGPEAHDPEADAAAEAEAAERREERRRVIAYNKAWASAEPVSREWLAGIVARKTTPQGTAALICAALVPRPPQPSKAQDPRPPHLLPLHSHPVPPRQP